MANNDEYWAQREAAERKWIDQNLKDDKAYGEHLNQYYDKAMKGIQDRINDQYTRFAGKDGYDIAEAKKAVSAADMQAFEQEAKQVVADSRKIFAKNGKVQYSDFSNEVNQHMRLYNATMRINRLEYLKAQIGMEAVKAGVDVGTDMAGKLTQGYLDEVKRQAGLLGQYLPPTEFTDYKRAFEIVMTGGNHGGFSSILWKNTDAMKSQLDMALTNALVQGLNSRMIARDLRQNLQSTVGNTKYAAERLARTEMARVQSRAQDDCYHDLGVKKVKWIAEPSACRICVNIASQNEGVYKIDDVPTLPAHANCRCSKAPKADRDEMEKLIAKANAERDAEKNAESFLNSKTVSEQELRRAGSKVYDSIFTAKRQKLISDYRDKSLELRKRIILHNKGEFYNGKFEKYDVIVKARKDLAKERTKMQNQLIKDVTAEVGKHRSIGLAKGESQAFNSFSTKTNMNRIGKVLNSFPTDWGNTSKDRVIYAMTTKRGFYDHSHGYLAVSGSGASAMTTTFHEMGHRMEHMIPDIRRVEHEFYARRTKDENLELMSKVTGNKNYGISEKTRVDNFLNPYMGKDYGNSDDSYYELLSMGTEALYTGSIDLTKDKDFATFILGIITMM